ncbi:hypothetical protein OQA88_7069 [Cercophora sp. LCS_1]
MLSTDWKRQSFGLFVPRLPTILGSDISGVITVSSNPTLPIGTRVLATTPAFTSADDSVSAFQEYTLAPITTVTPIPDSITHVQAATLASATGVAALLLNDVLGVKLPGWDSGVDDSANSAILVWGGASSVGNLVIQLAVMAGYAVFATASGRHHERLVELGVKGVVDYRDERVVARVLEMAGAEGKEIKYGVDVVSSEETVQQVGEVLKAAKGGRVVLGRTLPMGTVPEGIEGGVVGAESLWDGKKKFGKWLYTEALPVWLREGKVAPLEYKLFDGGLDGIQAGLDELKKGARGEKFVVELQAGEGK